MKKLKIRKSKKLQDLADTLVGSQINRVADLSVPYDGDRDPDAFLDDQVVNELTHFIEQGLFLANLYNKRVAKKPSTAIYVVTVELNGGGEDSYYFVNTLQEVVRLLWMMPFQKEN